MLAPAIQYTLIFKISKSSSEFLEMFTDSWIYRGFMRFDLWTKQHGGQGIDRRKMHSFEFGHLHGDYLGLNIVLRSFVMQRWISMKDHTTLCLHAEFGATHAKPPLSLISRWNKEHYVDFWQPPDISRSHLYRGTFPWTPTTAIYRAYTVPEELKYQTYGIKQKV